MPHCVPLSKQALAEQHQRDKQNTKVRSVTGNELFHGIEDTHTLTRME